ncbi:unnamed protein product [Darwinula stevensoni]|uniref:Uncharacterized protein n=1 Tax=Darwinula stevensoni TaxID=69355 RepID=A0A7R8XAJ3_9CRUS|nr:unnamed protein product [Darwinula stevensoni]CAG0891440.1 unnamed protein product [Darwinula stevensoni]
MVGGEPLSFPAVTICRRNPVFVNQSDDSEYWNGFRKFAEFNLEMKRLLELLSSGELIRQESSANVSSSLNDTEQNDDGSGNKNVSINPFAELSDNTADHTLLRLSFPDKIEIQNRSRFFSRPPHPWPFVVVQRRWWKKNASDEPSRIVRLSENTSWLQNNFFDFYRLDGSLPNKDYLRRELLGDFHDMKQSVRHCTFNGELCNDEDFSEVETEAYGKCLVFTHVANGSNQWVFLGSSGSQSSEFFINDYSFFKGMKPSALGRTVYTDSSRFRKLFWFSVFLCATGYMTYGIIDTINMYMSGRTITTSQMVGGEPLSFPAVTICRRNPVFVNQSDDSEYWNGFRKFAEFNLEMKRLLELLSSGELIRQESSANVSSSLNDTEQNDDGSGNKNVSINPFAELSDNTADHTLLRLSFPDKIEIQNRSGFFSRPPHPWPFVVVRRRWVMIHPPGLQPNPLEEGFDVNMEMISYIGVRKTVMERLPPDQGGNCATESYLENRFDPEIFNFSVKRKFSKQLCLRMCFLQLIPRANRWGWDDSLLRITSDYKWMNETDHITVVNIYYEVLSAEELTQQLLYPWGSFVGMLGGLLGLYTGLSFITVLEMLEWILDLLLYGWRKPRSENMGSKRRVILTWRDNEERDAESWKSVMNSRFPLEYDFGDMTSTNKAARSAAFDLAFYDRYI